MKHKMNVLLCLIGILFFALIVNYFVGHSRLLREGLTPGAESTMTISEEGNEIFSNRANLKKFIGRRTAG
jgi:hypothetical protein